MRGLAILAGDTAPEGRDGTIPKVQEADDVGPREGLENDGEASARNEKESAEEEVQSENVLDGVETSPEIAVAREESAVVQSKRGGNESANAPAAMEAAQGGESVVSPSPAPPVCVSPDSVLQLSSRNASSVMEEESEENGGVAAARVEERVEGRGILTA